jgi:phosphate/sulfate permease
MQINCERIVEKYLLNQNPLYAFNIPLSILIAIIVFGIAKANDWSKNSYINQILIPIVSFLLSIVVIDMVSRAMIDNSKKQEFVQLCKVWMNDSNIKNNILDKNIDMDFILNSNEKFTRNQEHFTSYDGRPLNKEVDYENNVNTKRNLTMNLSSKEQPIDSVHELVSEIANINPGSLEYIKYDSSCIKNSDCCSICSGDGNPCNLISPIPGPQYLPRTAKAIQSSLVNNNYTQAKCKF